MRLKLEQAILQREKLEDCVPRVKQSAPCDNK
jgi:hypothetical protein